MTSLRGHAIPIVLPLGRKRPDHTYVTSDDGYAWGCWGRSAGGRTICDGPGSSSFADCLSQTNSRAGIVYGFTGVCHQTANRILFPAGRIVVGARYFYNSMAVYGVFGRGSWPQLNTCASVVSRK
jgi:hypothetical protein